MTEISVKEKVTLPVNSKFLYLEPHTEATSFASEAALYSIPINNYFQVEYAKGFKSKVSPQIGKAWFHAIKPSLPLREKSHGETLEGPSELPIFRFHGTRKRSGEEEGPQRRGKERGRCSRHQDLTASPHLTIPVSRSQAPKGFHCTPGHPLKRGIPQQSA